MRKTAALFFIILANICLLAHAVIPHHHHDKKVVAIFGLMGIFGHEQHSHCHPHLHHQYGNDDYGCHCYSHQSEDCLLNETLLVSFREKGPGQCSIDQGVDDITLFVCNAAGQAFEAPQLPKKPTDTCRKQADRLPRACILSNGLRAPPHC